MKTRIFYLVALCSLLVACVREFTTDNNLVTKNIIITANWGEKGLTKTTLQDNGTSVWWSPTDKINVFLGDLYSAKFSSTLEAPAQISTFTGTLTMVSGALEEVNGDSPFWAIYPYDEENICDGNSVTLSIPSTQRTKAGTFANKVFPAIARSQSPELSFYNVCGGACFSVFNEDIVSITFKSNAGESLGGKVRVSFDDAGFPVLDDVLEGTDEVLVIAPEGGFVPGINYYAVFLPQVLSNGITMTFEREDGKKAIYSLDNSITINRSRFGILDQKDRGLVFSGEPREEVSITVDKTNHIFVNNRVTGFDISIKSNVDYDIIIDESCEEWLTLDKNEPFSWDDTKRYWVNIAQSTVEKRRIGYIYVRDKRSSKGVTVTVVQAPVSEVFGRILYPALSSNHQRNFNLNDDLYAHYFAEGLNWTDHWRYNEGWGRIFWMEFYNYYLPDYWKVDEFVSDDPENNGIKAANDITNVILWLRVVDRFGDAPYMDDNGNRAKSGTNMKYTLVEKIYLDLIQRLEQDVKLLTAPGSSVFDTDELYNNNWEKWRKLANTLIMRLSMRLSNTSLAGTVSPAFINAMDGAMSESSDYARVRCNTAVWGDYYDRTHNDWSNTFTNCDFMDMMNGVNVGYSTGVIDPRRYFWFIPGTTPSIEGSNWDGYPVGYLNDSEKSSILAAHGGVKSYARLNMHESDGFFYYSRSGMDNLSFCLASHSETLFLMTEAALRGWIPGDPESLFKDAIIASIDEVAVFGGGRTVPDYQKEAYINSLPPFGTTSEEKLRSIMIQKWIALYPNSEEAWTEQRRTGYPDYYGGVLTYPVVSPESYVENGNIIQRLPYPDKEYEDNLANMPSECQTGKRDQQANIFWALGGMNNTQSKNTPPKNF